MSEGRDLRGPFAVSVVLLLLAVPARAQSTATLQGRVFDATAAVIRGATISVRNDSAGFTRSATTDDEGRYHAAAIPAGIHEITVAAAGFKSVVIEALSVDVGRTLTRDFHLEVGDIEETVIIGSERPPIDRASTAVSHVVTAPTVEELPLNGRYLTDLGLLVPGSVTPSQTGFSTTPTRGLGAFSINTAGNREEAVGFLVNGVTINNLTFGSLPSPLSIASVQEFKIDNTAFSTEHGHVSGAILNIVTRSGSNTFRGEAYEFFRNDALDARNFFEFTTPEPHPFRRDQFGGYVSGPIVRRHTFFFATYEGVRQRQGEDMNSLVLSGEQRAAVTDPAIRRLIELIPLPNFMAADGTPRFVGSAQASVDANRWTVDLQQNLGRNDRIHAFFRRERNATREPSWNGNTIPGFGRVVERSPTIVTVDETRVFNSRLLNEARFGRSGGRGIAKPGNDINPADLGIRNGISRPIGLPHLIVAGSLNFGGPSTYPTGRDDTSYVFSDTLTYSSGRHLMKLGGEYRHFINKNFEEGTGAFNFPTVAAFLAGTANAFSITLGERTSHIDQRALAFFLQDSLTIRPQLTVDLGLRYEWHMTPTERNNQFVVFDAATVSLLRVGVDRDEIYEQNNRNFEPRVGIAWDPWRNGRTVVRGAYRWAVDEPGTTAVRNTAANPPFATPLTAAGVITLGDAIQTTAPAGLSPATTDPRFRNASVQSWNVNVQRQLARDLAATVGYMGSRGKDLRISRNVNQPVNGVRPFVRLSASSPIRPNAPLANIIQVESTGFSNYHALWLSATKRLSRGLQFDASYTWSKSLDTNSLNSSGFAVQDSYDIPNQYGLSDFDARHRFVLSATYALPFAGHVLARGWQIAVIVQAQSGNPVNIVTSNSTLNGMPNTVRPDVTGPIRIVGEVDEWFDPSVFVAVDRFGNLGRNVVIGPGFRNTDLAIIKDMRAGRFRVQLRADIFDLFNHPNFGPPGNVVGSPTFGKITTTRFPTGEAGSSRQIQLAAKLSF